jgi:predicted DNA-binding protein YlxM (UPF0122 family)|tara:strand:- start:22 stop:792 length:771 start_codon:yes stop_codon:yes gene_type:complete
LKSRQFNKVKPYCYILTRLKDEKKYFGVRWQNVKYNRTPKKDFGKFYFTSNTKIKKSFKSNPKNFKFILHATFDSKIEAINYEFNYNKKNTIKSIKWINRAAYPQVIPTEKYNKIKSKRMRGKGNPNFGKKHSKKIKEFISKNNKGNKPWNKGVPRSQKVKDAISKKNKGKIGWNKGKKTKKRIIFKMQLSKFKLNEKQMITASKLWAKGISLSTISKRYKISVKAVHRACNFIGTKYNHKLKKAILPKSYKNIKT